MCQLLEVCGQAFLDAGQKEVYTTVRDPALPVADRLRTVVSGLNRSRFVLVLDNFECNLDEGTRQILDGELAGFYRYLFGQLVGGSRLIITSRYLPADVPQLPATATEWQLGEFGEAAFLKFLLRDAQVEQRYRRGELPHELLVRLHRVLGATPRFLGQIRTVLATLAADELAGETRSDRPARCGGGGGAPGPAAGGAGCLLRDDLHRTAVWASAGGGAAHAEPGGGIWAAGDARSRGGGGGCAGGGGAGGGGAVAGSGAGARRRGAGAVVGLRHAAQLAAGAAVCRRAPGGAPGGGRLPGRPRRRGARLDGALRRAVRRVPAPFDRSGAASPRPADANARPAGAGAELAALHRPAAAGRRAQRGGADDPRGGAG